MKLQEGRSTFLAPSHLQSKRRIVENCNSSCKDSSSAALLLVGSASTFNSTSVGPAKANKVKIFSGPCYMIKRVLTFVLGVQESVLVDFISQNKVKNLQKVKTCQNYIFLYFFEFLSCY